MTLSFRIHPALRLVECWRDSLRDAGGAAALPGADSHGDPAEGNGARGFLMNPGGLGQHLTFYSE